MVLLTLIPVFFFFSVICLGLYGILWFIWDATPYYLIILPLIILFPLFLIALGWLADFYDTKKRIKPFLFTLVYFLANIPFIIIFAFIPAWFFIIPSTFLIFIIFMDIGIYMRRFYVKNKTAKEFLAVFEDGEDDEKRDAELISYGKVRK